MKMHKRNNMEKDVYIIVQASMYASRTIQK